MTRPEPALTDVPGAWDRENGDGFSLHVAPSEDARMAFAESVVRGLETHPRAFEARFLYDHDGSEIYEEITKQPEYYLTGAEDAILAAHAEQIRDIVGDVALVELGSGSSTKTRRLLDAWTAHGPARYVPIDISPSAIRQAATALTRDYPSLVVEGIASTYDEGFPLIGALGPLMLSFLGSSIGNLTPAETDRFLARIAEALPADGFFLLGVDLVKDPAVLEAAYNDDAMVSDRFTKNLFHRMNRELGTEIPVRAVDHVAFYNDRLERVEIYARFNQEVHIHVRPLDRSFRIAAGEMIRTEISRKYRIDEVASNASRFGFDCVHTWQHSGFGLLLLRRRRDAPYHQQKAAGYRATLERVRGRTYAIANALSDRALTRQHDTRMSPIMWDLNHIADFERLWLITNLEAPGTRGELDPRFNADLHPRATRGSLSIPDRQATYDRLARVRREASALLEAGLSHPLTDGGYVYQLIAQHEAQHQETIFAAIELLPDEGFAPGFKKPTPPRPDEVPRGMVKIPAGPFRMGTNDPLAYDNERPAHLVHLDDFFIDVTPVTNAAYQEFIEDGGYDNRAVWTDEGWAWVQQSGVGAPEHWRRDNGHWRTRIMGEEVDVDPGRPVIHVNWFEADAFARWAGKRLPTEAEWEKAAAWDAGQRQARIWPWGDERPDRTRANIGHRHLQTAPIGAYPHGRSFYGVHQLMGDVWEWTSTWFDGYPGFEAYPYPEYSEIFFGESYRVLRGSSWATDGIVARNTFRNWDFPDRRQIFAGFRCAR